VADHQTGLLVHYDPGDPEFFESRLAEAVNGLVAEPERAREYGAAGRQRCIDEFSWRTSPSRPWRSTGRCLADLGDPKTRRRVRETPDRCHVSAGRRHDVTPDRI
jgi:hypothetical protein